VKRNSKCRKVFRLLNNGVPWKMYYNCTVILAKKQRRQDKRAAFKTFTSTGKHNNLQKEKSYRKKKSQEKG
jgi:hypothetical protein